MMKKPVFSVRSMVFTAIMAALLCIAAPFSLPIPSAVPLSLATFMIYLIGALLGRAKGTAAVGVYILIGAVGLPVFSGFMGGFAHVAGVTGGYIIGYIPCVFLTGLFTELSCGKLRGIVTGMTLGTLALYAFGTIWFMLFTGSELTAALTGCVMPFLPFDVLKMIVACAVAVPLRNRLLPVIKGEK